ncbi:hypothetical protein [Akkermansia glycaniphila]|nr:hypothetical protein [Akkermansia glycaniphila]
MKFIVSCVCLVTCFLLQSVDAKTSFQEDRPEWFVNRCVVLPEHGSVLVHIILPEAQAKDEIAASQVSIAAYDHLHRRVESWEPGHVLNAPTPDYWDGMAPDGMQRLVRWMTVPLKRGMNFIVVRNEVGTPSQEVIPLFCARDFRIFLAPSSKILAGNGLRDKNHPLAISTPTLGWIVGEDAQGSLVFDVSLALKVRNVRYDRSAERLSCKLVFQNTSRQPVEIPVWGYRFALRDQASRINLLVDDDFLYSGDCFCPDDEVLQGLVPVSVQLQPRQSFEREFSFSNVPLPPGRHDLRLEHAFFPLEYPSFVLHVVKSDDSTDQSTRDHADDYSLPPYLIFLSEKDRGKELKQEETIDGVRYRLFYAPAGEYNPPQGSFVVPDLGQDKFDFHMYAYYQEYLSRMKPMNKE